MKDAHLVLVDLLLRFEQIQEFFLEKRRLTFGVPSSPIILL